jgi:succinylarginine dihydrolase
VSEKDIALKDVVKSYLFNSQIVTVSSGEQVLVAPVECSENSAVKSYLDHWVGNDQFRIKKVMYYDLRESMQNGGGPACLRLRVPMS